MKLTPGPRLWLLLLRADLVARFVRAVQLGDLADIARRLPGTNTLCDIHAVLQVKPQTLRQASRKALLRLLGGHSLGVGFAPIRRDVPRGEPRIGNVPEFVDIVDGRIATLAAEARRLLALPAAVPTRRAQALSLQPVQQHILKRSAPGFLSATQQALEHPAAGAETRRHHGAVEVARVPVHVRGFVDREKGAVGSKVHL
mmetsp:Transcript_92357/g.266624  ORF Transcript_92357/g.266624 Transcript_92357/m.266624 type:complete len:200 (-) Transcript_92357:1250-1849(-)